MLRTCNTKHTNVKLTNSRINILQTKIDVLNMLEIVNLAEQYVKTKTPLHIIGINADKINQINKNKRLKKIVNSCGVISADGGSIIMASKVFGTPLPERIPGIDLMDNLIKLSEEKGYSIYLLGGKQDIAQKVSTNIKNKYPKIRIIGICNGYFKETDWNIILKDLKKKRPDFVFVGISSPLKEYLIDYLMKKDINSVFVGVGGTFDIISGQIKRAPIWMRKMYLEWLYRFFQEPKRLFKRYFFGNIIFIISVIKEKIKK